METWEYEIVHTPGKKGFTLGIRKGVELPFESGADVDGFIERLIIARLTAFGRPKKVAVTIEAVDRSEGEASGWRVKKGMPSRAGRGDEFDGAYYTVTLEEALRVAEVECRLGRWL